MINLNRTNKVAKSVNEIVDKGLISHSEKEFINHWKTYLAIALLDDLDTDLASDIADIINAIVSTEEVF